MRFAAEALVSASAPPSKPAPGRSTPQDRPSFADHLDARDARPAPATEIDEQRESAAAGDAEATTLADDKSGVINDITLKSGDEASTPNQTPAPPPITLAAPVLVHMIAASASADTPAALIDQAGAPVGEDASTPELTPTPEATPEAGVKANGRAGQAGDDAAAEAKVATPRQEAPAQASSMADAAAITLPMLSAAANSAKAANTAEQTNPPGVPPQLSTAQPGNAPAPSTLRQSPARTAKASDMAPATTPREASVQDQFAAALANDAPHAGPKVEAQQAQQAKAATTSAPDILFRAVSGEKFETAPGLHGSGLSSTSASQASHMRATGEHEATRAAPAAAQVAREIVRRFNGESTRFELRLDPPELGRVEVRLEVSRDHRVTAVVSADSPQALTDLARHARELEQSLQAAGLELADNGLSFDLRQGSEEQDDAQAGGGRNLDEEEIEAAPLARPVGLERWRGVRVDVMA